MSRLVGVSVLFALTVLAASCAGARHGAELSESTTRDVRIAVAVHDFDMDGSADTLTLVMLEGGFYEDTVAWCGGGDAYGSAIRVGR